jgi:hypothetical protein
MALSPNPKPISLAGISLVGKSPIRNELSHFMAFDRFGDLHNRLSYNALDCREGHMKKNAFVCLCQVKKHRLFVDVISKLLFFYETLL